ncbi:hypothetical protein GCM10011378_37230 [Hymenobacter glacieicola]|uniref:Glycoside hydrolase family 2 catalytic domain-containing protein n=1 Tax=Hymenobacter glacieicola TaxID=1562124 RepID=A0ABQ1X7F2_9BACT|nr:hypothetical protein GCM10011378_37230 [Hymenobacter glacieicola]
MPVKVVRTAQGYQLLRGGKPYFIKGGAGLHHYDQLQAAGANSVRLWSADYADDRMNEAHRHGLTVMLGLWLEHASKKFDYYDKEQVARQKENLRRQVLQYRYHPALLAWDVGNELDLESATPQVFRSVNDIARMIHELDPYHPVTTTLTSSVVRLKQIKSLCPAIDFISFNAFGNLLDLGERLEKIDGSTPYLVTEFGARGYWESPVTSWQAAKEQNSTQQAAFIRQRYLKTVLGDRAACLGSYVFFWGNKFEYTPTWFSLFAPTGEKTAVVDVMQELWSGRAPRNRAPNISDLWLTANGSHNNQLLPQTEYVVQLATTDPENDSLRTVWEVFPDIILKAEANDTRESSLATPSDAVRDVVLAANSQRAVLRTPQRPGAYRLSVHVFDGQGSVATASLPFYVLPSQGLTAK